LVSMKGRSINRVSQVHSDVVEPDEVNS
jgi:hypothetical protein